MHSRRRQISILLRWAGKDKWYLLLSVLCSTISGLCTMVPYYGVYQLMAAGFGGWISYPVILENSILIIAAMLIRFILFGSSGVLSHKGAYGALFKVRCIGSLLPAMRRCFLLLYRLFPAL